MIVVKFDVMAIRDFRYLPILIVIGFMSQNLFSQSFDKPFSPILLRNSVLFGSNHYGFQIGLGKQVLEIQKKKIFKNGKEKLIEKHRFMFINAGFYNQSYLHLNIFSTLEYAMVRNYKKGWYREFMPALGLSRTFLHETVYQVNDQGEVSFRRMAGDWRLAGGASIGVGKKLNIKKAPILNDFYFKLNTQIFYPNFRFITVKPSFVFGLNIQLAQYKQSYKTISKTKYQWNKRKS